MLDEGAMNCRRVMMGSEADHPDRARVGKDYAGCNAGVIRIKFGEGIAGSVAVSGEISWHGYSR